MRRMAYAALFVAVGLATIAYGAVTTLCADHDDPDWDESAW